MKRSIIAVLLIFGCIAALFIACPADQDDNPDRGDGAETLTFSVSTESGAKYFSLTTGEEVSGEAIKSKAWDIGFQRSRLIYTNSGDTAAEFESGGQGEVWYTEQFVFDDVTSKDDAVTDDTSLLKGYTTDVKRWIKSMTTDNVCVNVMGYVGYANETENGAGGTLGTALADFQYPSRPRPLGASWVCPHILVGPGPLGLVRCAPTR
ncbi:MAG: HmuY family protein [Treponema sp.]|jgi:hypothetical protein|nr:HmuY family protein [Treponema sp.]